MQPGDAIIHSARTVHWSRKSESFSLRRRAVSYFYWKTSTLQDNAQAKMAQALKKSHVAMDIDVAKAVAALASLDRPWATSPGISKMLRDDPHKFLEGLKMK